MLRPTAPDEREPVLDVLRGVAVLGILLVNIQLMRGPDVYLALTGDAPELTSVADRVTSFLIGWLAAGKFISSFAILFGIGAAIVVDRARRAGRRPRPLLARRYAWLLLVGLLHMLLLFPGDILFVYGLTGMILLAFVDVRARTALWWGVGSIAVASFVLVANEVATAALTAAGDEEVADAMTGIVDQVATTTVAAYADGGPGAVIAANAWQSLLVQGSQLLLIPWVLGAFLLGLAVTRAGIVRDLAGHRRLLRRIAFVGLGVGLPLNLAVGVTGPLGIDGGPGAHGVGTALLAALGSHVGAPLLAAGYLAGIALLCLRAGTSRTLAATGRMALTAYLAQSVIAAVVFVGLGRYGELTVSSSLVVVVGTWAVVLVGSSLWLARWRTGPIEWLWRWATYGSRPPSHPSRDLAPPSSWTPGP